jgi:hypothetical protein
MKMLKVVVMIDCNICGQLFDRVCVSSDRDPMAWKAMSMDLEYRAKECGWNFNRSAHHCDWCANHHNIDYSETMEREKNELPF